MLLLYLLGCDSDTKVSQDETPLQEELASALDYHFEPPTVDFGTRPLLSEAVIPVRLVNRGDEDLLLVDINAQTGSRLEVGSPDIVIIPPQEAASFELRWTPGAVGTLNDEIQLRIGSSPQSTEVVSLPVLGTGYGSVLTTSVSSLDFGEVNLGCSTERSLTFTNAGSQSLRIEDIALRGDGAYSMTLQPDANADGSTEEDEEEGPPWTLSPYQSRELRVLYRPTEREYDIGTVEISTADGVVSTALTGQGSIDSERRLSYTVGETARTTVLFNVNDVAIRGTYSTQFWASLPAFFQTLLDNGVRFRVGFIHDPSGSIVGDYIDDSYDADDAAETVQAMLSGLGYTDNDQNLSSLVNGISMNESWLFEDELWTASRLSLVGINRDTEQSGGAWSTYVSQAQAWKDDTDDIRFHGIGGLTPTTCGYAEPFSTFEDAVNATGGVFFDICATDWEPFMAQLALASMEGGGFFPLTGDPMVESIELWVDGEPELHGWSYDVDLNAIVFSPSAYPQDGAEVEIRYLVSTTCE